MKKFIFTCGDINGVGPEIVIKVLNKIANKTPNIFFFVCPKNVFEKAARLIKPAFKYSIINSVKNNYHTTVNIINIGNYRQKTGYPTLASGKAAFKAVKLSADLLINGDADAVVTAPISKEAVQLAGYNFPGHTEMYAEWTNTTEFVMMFLSKKMKAGLTTIHIPVKKISKLITKNIIKNKLNVITYTLKNDLGIKTPKIAVLGLNPHAGEAGYIGREEQDIIKPALLNYKTEADVQGPFSPDAFFANKMYEKFDFVLGMYHDQILIPFKLLNFGGGVNYTAGLPIIRTSPDHGTAFNIAGKNVADESSMLEAFYYARKIVNNRKRNNE